MQAIEEIIDAEIIEDIEFDAPLTPRQQQIKELRWVLDTLDANPDMPMPYNMQTIIWYPADVVEAAKVAKTLGGKWEKNDPNEGDFDAEYLVMKRKVDREVTLDVTISRGRVCKKKVVGKKLVKKAVVVQPERTEEQYVEVDDVQFECGSLLSAAAQLTMDRLAAIAQ